MKIDNYDNMIIEFGVAVKDVLNRDFSDEHKLKVINHYKSILDNQSKRFRSKDNFMGGRYDD